MALSQTDRKKLILLTVAGLCSALISISLLLLSPKAEPLVFRGLIFGLSISAALAYSERRLRSPIRLLLFPAICVAADRVSMSAGLWVYLALPRHHPVDGNVPDEILPFAVLAGGFVGAVIVLAFAKAFFEPRRVTWRFWSRCLVCALVAGVAGLVGWFAGAVHPLLKYSSSAVIRAILVWQPTVALCIGLNVLRGDAPEVMIRPEFGSQTPPAAAAHRTTDKLTRLAFWSATLGFLCWGLFGYTQLYFAKVQQHHIVEQAIAEAPSIDHLPDVRRRPPETVLILEAIGGLFVIGKPYVSSISAHPTWSIRVSKPQCVTYSVSYVRSKDLPFGLYQPSTRADVTEYPNTNWARYLAEFSDDVRRSQNTSGLVKTTRLSSHVLLDSSRRYPSGGGPLTYIWSSGNFVVSVSSDKGDVNAAILDRYLIRYPSSL